MGIEEQIDRLIDLGEEIRDSLKHLKAVRLRDALRAAGPKVFDEPAEPPEPEYREPVLPADAGQPCEFSMTEKDWYPSLLSGFQVHNNPWISSSLGCWNFARIKKDA